MTKNEFPTEKNRLSQITSTSNSRVVEYAKLSDDKYRKRSGLFLAEGVKLAREAVRYATVHEIVLTETALEKLDEGFLDELDGGSYPVTVLSEQAFSKISTEKAPQGIIAIVENPTKEQTLADFSAWQENKRLLMLDEIRDPGNLGTILRTAEAFGITGVILSRCADAYSPKTVRASMGSVFRMPLFPTNDGGTLAGEMNKLGRRVLGATLGDNNVSLGSYETNESDCPVIGNEGHGISAPVLSACSMTVRIPMAGETESLNASAAAVCILWEYFRKTATK